MTNDIAFSPDQIKNTVVKTKGTPTQKLLAILMLAGVDKTADLAAMTGLSERAVQTAKRNLLRETDCGTQPIAAQPVAETQPVAGQNAIHCASEKKVPPHTPLQRKTTQPATVETGAARAGVPDGDFAECKTAFNGSTEAMLAEVERFMGGHCRKNAEQWLANLLRAQGQQAVIESYQSLLTARAEGEIITHPLRWWPSMAIKAKAKAKALAPAVEPATPWAAITIDMKRNVKPAPGSVRLPEITADA